MSYMISPKNDSGDGGGAIKNPGPHVLCCVGFMRKKSMAGNQMIEAYFTCVEGDTDIGGGLFETFVLVDTAHWRMANYCIAAGYEEDFDAMDDAAVNAVLRNGPAIAHVKIEQYTNREGQQKDKPVVDRWESYGNSGFKKEWDDTIRRAEEWYNDFKAERDSGGGNRRPYSPSQDPTQDNPAYADSDIPF